MSDLKKWMNIVEQIMPTVINAAAPTNDFAADETVIISPTAGGGVARFIQRNGSVCTVDVKGIIIELPLTDISKSPVIGDDPFTTGHNKSHINISSVADELLKDRPDPQNGDLVRIENVYGTSIGPGLGVFMSYSTTGEEAIVSFDGQVLTVPVEQISSVVEQDSEDEFKLTGNDGALSPMSLGAENRYPELTQDGDSIMSHKDEFAKWIASIEDGINGSVPNSPMQSSDQCCCKQWDCPVCFPDDCADNSSAMGDDLADIGVVILDDEYSDHEYNNNTADYAPGLRDQSPAPDVMGEPSISGAPEDVSELIGKIQYMQDMGLSASDKHYDPEQLMNIDNTDVIKRIYAKVMGNVQEQVHEDIEDEPSAAEFFGYGKDDDECDLSGIEDETPLLDTLSSMEKKIAIAKAALARKSEVVDEEDVDTVAKDHGLSSLGNKIVNAKMKHHGVAASTKTEEEDMLVPDPEIMEWVARFAAKDKLVQENTDRSVPAVTIVAADTPAATHEGADEETMAWMKRFNNLDKK